MNALDTVLAWELSDASMAAALTAQANLLAGGSPFRGPRKAFSSGRRVWGRTPAGYPTKAVTAKTVTTKAATTKAAAGKAATLKVVKAAKPVAAVPSPRVLTVGRCPTVSGKSTLTYHPHRGGRQRVAGRRRQRSWRHHHGRRDEVLRLSCLGGGSMSRQGRVILDGDEREALHTIAFPAKRGRIGRWHNLG